MRAIRDIHMLLDEVQDELNVLKDELEKADKMIACLTNSNEELVKRLALHTSVLP